MVECYLCNREATSREHSPAQSYFPVTKRKDLMTVPSCSVHNENTSLDDEYVRNLILLTRGNNEIAEIHFKNKGIRSLQRSPALRSLMTKNTKLLNFIKDDEQSKNIAFEVDRNRFDRVMRKIAYGIYYFSFVAKWNRELQVATRHLITDELQADPIAELIQRNEQENPFEINWEGSNPDIFTFSFLYNRATNSKILVMKFYEWFEVWIVPTQNVSLPSLDLQPVE